MNAAQTKEYIIKQLNLADLLPGEQETVIKKLEENIEKRVFIAILDTLDEKRREELLALSEKSEMTEANSLIEKAIPNVKEIIARAAKEVVEDFKKRS